MGSVKRFFYLALIGCITVALTQVASAADLPRKAPAVAPAPPPAPTWTGCYLAGGGGYGLFAVDHFGTNTAGQLGFVPMTTGGNGWFGTAGAGCDYQFTVSNWGSWLIGAFGDYDWMDLKGDHGWQCIVANGCSYNGGAGSTAQAATSLKESSAWYVGARLGFVVAPNVMTYVSGGYTQTRFNQVALLQPFSGTNPTTWTGAVLPEQTFHGWFLGGGTEIAFPWVRNLYLKTEYRYAKYDTRNVPVVCVAAVAFNGCSAVGFTGVFDNQQPVVQTIRTELVYRFNFR